MKLANGCQRPCQDIFVDPRSSVTWVIYHLRLRGFSSLNSLFIRAISIANETHFSSISRQKLSMVRQLLIEISLTTSHDVKLVVLWQGVSAEEAVKLRLHISAFHKPKRTAFRKQFPNMWNTPHLRLSCRRWIPTNQTVPGWLRIETQCYFLICLFHVTHAASPIHKWILCIQSIASRIQQAKRAAFSVLCMATKSRDE